MPAACTPDRAVPWIEGRSEAEQKPCHCPPTSMCPQTYEEYSTPNTGKMPMKLVSQCCPVIEPEKCPEGTSMAGQKMPADGNCSPFCPAGTQLAGHKMPADGKCNPYESCPTKYYPSLSKVGIDNDVLTSAFNAEGTVVATAGVYKYGNGKEYPLEYKALNKLINYRESYGDTASIERYNFSLYLDNVSWSLQAETCQLYGVCPVKDFYNPINNTHADQFNASPVSLRSLIAVNGRDALTWFGYMVARTEGLGDNYVTPNLAQAWNGRDVFQIADYDIGAMGTVNNQKKFDNDPLFAEIQGAAPKFIEQCKNAAGEYVELDELTVNGNRCQYLQCRYVFESTNTSCMTGDTKITLADGSSKALKDVTIGEQVKGKDGVYKVTALNTYQSKLRVLYGINGSGPMITGDHPIRTTEGWKLITDDAAAQSADKPGFAKTKLAVGDTLVTDKGDVKVTDITRFPSIQPVSTYNIQVDGNASFFANGFEVRGFDKMEMKY